MTMPDVIQFEGSFKLGPVGGPLVEVGNQFTSVTLQERRTSITIPATYGLAEESDANGAIKRMLAVSFLQGITAASAAAVLAEAIGTDSGELDFEYIADDDSVSSDNPRHSGTLVISSVDSGGAAASVRQQSQTWPVKRGTYDKASS